MHRYWLSFCVIAFFLTSHQALAERAALVIGNDAYTHLKVLNQAISDADAVGRVLSSYPQEQRFAPTALENADRRSMMAAIDAFSESLQGGGEVALFYYAGHAVQFAGEPWLLPVDTDIRVASDIRSFGIALSYITSKLKDRGWKAVVVVIDACRNEMFTGSGAPERVRAAGLARGLGRVESVDGLLIAYATAAGDVARESADARNSVYTSVLLSHLRRPGVDLIHMFNGARLT